VNCIVYHENKLSPGRYSSYESRYSDHDYKDIGIVTATIANVTSTPANFPQQTTEDATLSNIHGVYLYLEQNNNAEPNPNYTLEILVNGSVTYTKDFTITWSTSPYVSSPFFELRDINIPAFSAPPSATIDVRIVPQGSSSNNPDWKNVEYQLLGQYLYTRKWGYGHATTKGGGADFLCPEELLQLVLYESWTSTKTVQYTTIFAYGEPVYPARVNNGHVELDLTNPTHSVAPGSGNPGWSFGQDLDPPAAPYTGYGRVVTC
jgi:hypothetical protein